MARPAGSTAEVHKIRRDYRFAPETMQQIADGITAFGGSLKETAFVERAIAHYAEFLAGDPEALAPLTQEMKWLQDHIRQLRHDQQTSYGVAQDAAEKTSDQAEEIAHLQAQVRALEQEQYQAQAASEQAQAQIRKLERELRTTQTAQHQAEGQLTRATHQATRKKKPVDQEPHITLDSLKPDGMMGSFWLKWEQYGLLAVASLDPINEQSSAYGYKLDCSYSHAIHPEKRLTERQEEQATMLIKLARAKLVEELLKAGWQPETPENPEASVWYYR